MPRAQTFREPESSSSRTSMNDGAFAYLGDESAIPLERRVPLAKALAHDPLSEPRLENLDLRFQKGRALTARAAASMRLPSTVSSDSPDTSALMVLCCSVSPSWTRGETASRRPAPRLESEPRARHLRVASRQGGLPPVTGVSGSQTSCTRRHHAEAPIRNAERGPGS